MSRKQDADKARYWQRTIREAARSGVSIREFCRVRKLKVSQFYWWQHRWKETGHPRRPPELRPGQPGTGSHGRRHRPGARQRTSAAYPPGRR
jgi:transposase